MTNSAAAGSHLAVVLSAEHACRHWSALHYSSIAGLIEDSFKRYASAPAYTCMGKTITYQEMESMSRRIGAWLQSLGLEKGDRVAVMMPNILQMPVAMAAVLRAGYAVVNVNPLYTPRELEHQLKDSGAKAILILENFALTLQQVIKNRRQACLRGDHGRSAGPERPSGQFRCPEGQENGAGMVPARPCQLQGGPCRRPG
jgi:long-chain acyl-CoA synthetase